MVDEGYLLDTNVLSEPIRERPNLLLLERMAQHSGQLATAAPAFHEILFGMMLLPPSYRRRRVEEHLAEAVISRLPILEYDRTAAEWHARERARLVRLGRTPPFIDGQIAAIAATNGLTLITKNLRDFQHFQGLTVEDWSV
jgi:tRNA(fMet)-specific endonuclease VapC